LVLILACAASVGLFSASACGPSQQSIYEGTVRFEHCYRLDLDLEIAPSHREACWQQWLAAYTYGQPRDRIEYARRRMRAFAVGDTTRPVLELQAQPRQEARQFYLVVPSATSVYSPPPPVATRWAVDNNRPPSDAGVDAEAGSTTAPVPGDACTSACAEKLTSCQSACEPDAATTGKCAKCPADYKTCMRRCFE
jgi:hypothetical protein